MELGYDETNPLFCPEFCIHQCEMKRDLCAQINKLSDWRGSFMFLNCHLNSHRGTDETETTWGGKPRRRMNGCRRFR